MNRFTYLYYLTYLLILSCRLVNGELPREVLCVDHECTGVISTAKTTLQYSPNEKYLLPFKANMKVNILAKPPDPAQKYWGVDINGAVGFVSKDFLKEGSIMNRPKIVVPGKNFLLMKRDSKNGPNTRKINKQKFEEIPLTFDGDDIKNQSNENLSPDINLSEPSDSQILQNNEYESNSSQIQDKTDELIQNNIINPELGNQPSIDLEKMTNSLPVDSLNNNNKQSSQDSEQEITTETLIENNMIVNNEGSPMVNIEEFINEVPVNPNVNTQSTNVETPPTTTPLDTENDSNILNDTIFHQNLAQDNQNEINSQTVENDLQYNLTESVTAQIVPESPVANDEQSFIKNNVESFSTPSINNFDASKPLNLVQEPEIPKIEPVNNDIKESETLDFDLQNNSTELYNQSEMTTGTAINEIPLLQQNNIPESVPMEVVSEPHITVTQSSLYTSELSAAVPDLNDVDPTEHPITVPPTQENMQEAQFSENTSQQDTTTEFLEAHETNDPAFIKEIEGDQTNEQKSNDYIKSILEESLPTEFDWYNEFNSTEIETSSNDSSENEFSQNEDSNQIANNLEFNNDATESTFIPETIELSAENQTYMEDFNYSDTDVHKIEEEKTKNEQHTGVPHITKLPLFHNHKPLDSLLSNTKKLMDSNKHIDTEKTPDLENDSNTENEFNTISSDEILNAPDSLNDFFNQDLLNSDIEPSIPSNPIEDNSIPLVPNISDEKSFFSEPFIVFGKLFESVSSMLKFNNFGNVVDNTNQNVLNSDKLEPNELNNENFGKSEASSDFLSTIFTESQQCNIGEKNVSGLLDVSSDLIFWLIISAVSVLMFTLGYYYLENRKQDGKLLAMVNTLQKELLCSSKECILLKEELTVTKEKLFGIEDSSFGTDEMVACLKKELAESEQTISDLQDKLTIAEEELANSTEAAFELQSILDEQLTSKDSNTSSLGFTITKLQSQLDDQQTTMNLTKAQLAAKTEENEMLVLKAANLNSKLASLEKSLVQCQELLTQNTEESQSKARQTAEQLSSLEKTLLQNEEQKNTEINELRAQIRTCKDELNNTNAQLMARMQEVLSLQDNMKSLKLDEKNITALLDVSHTKAELTQISSEKTILSEKLEENNLLIAELTAKLNAKNTAISEMTFQVENAEQNALEATTRLEVLTNYFNQKEADLLKELSTKESLWISQQGEAMSTIEKIESVQKEIQQYKETSESMKRELAEQEAAWRVRVAALEQRAHEHWLARRAAERAAEASSREAQTLRQRLALPSPDKRVVSPLTTGEAIQEQPFISPLGALGQMLPPHPLGFLPPPLGGPMMLPPPLPPLPPHRPPPLGRLSSPPPLQSMRQDRYSPDSRYSPERTFSPQRRGRSPFSNPDPRRRGYNNDVRRYDNRYYDSDEDRRSRRYETETDFSPVNTLPPSPIPNPRNHKGISSGSGQSSESLERFVPQMK